MPDATTRPSTARVVAIGVGAGLLSGMFGVGGGILVVPALVLMLKFDQRLANGTSLGAVLPISVASLVTYWSHDNVDWIMAAWLVVGALGGAVLGTRWIHVLPRRVLGYLFAVMLLVTGTLAGLLGIGGGVVMVPAMIVFFSELNVVAKGTSVAVIIPTAIMGTWRNWKADNIDLRVATIVGSGGIVSAVVGGVIADRMSQDLSNILFASLVLVVATRMIFDLRRDTSD